MSFCADRKASATVAGAPGPNAARAGGTSGIALQLISFHNILTTLLPIYESVVEGQRRPSPLPERASPSSGKALPARHLP